MLVVSYDLVMIIIAIIVALIAFYSALDKAGRTARIAGQSASLWLPGGGFSMGTGFWLIHFVSMLALCLPMAMRYNVALTVLSMLIAVLSTVFALRLVGNAQLSRRRLAGGTLMLGCSVMFMQYTGMAALLLRPGINWHPYWLAASFVIALLACGTALWLTFHWHYYDKYRRYLRCVTAVVMGSSIAAMHYTSMAAMGFTANRCDDSIGVRHGGFTLLVTMMTLMMPGVALLATLWQSRLRIRRALPATPLTVSGRELTLYDRLTRLPNRLFLENHLRQVIRQAKEEKKQFALLFMDIDGFKAVNDAYGRHIGDTLLLAMTTRIRLIMQGNSLLARLGGDEFVLLMETCRPDKTALFAERLMKTVAEPFIIGRHKICVSLSIGIVLYPQDGEDERELMFNIDAALYHTKNRGRNGYSFFHPSMNSDIQDQLQLINDLWLALARNELRLFYQPQCCAPCGPVTGFEALLRWQHPQRGLLMPDAFLPQAEKTGLIVQIGNWVINEACRQLRCWHLQGKPHWSVAVNLSALQFEQNDLISTVTNALEQHHIPPSKLTLEITETTAMGNFDKSVRILTALTQLGMRASIDDFGTGYSSLLYLKRLPVSELKIDRAFVKGLCEGSSDATIITAIVTLAQSLNLTVVAEGVETRFQQAFLTDLGCHTLQGWLFGRALPPERITALDDAHLLPCPPQTGAHDSVMAVLN